MSRNKNIAVLTIGYHTYAFENSQTALTLMALLSEATQVREESWGVREITPCTYFLHEEPSLPELKYASSAKFNPSETVQEVKDRAQREKEDRQDFEQQMREAPAALPAPIFGGG